LSKKKTFLWRKSGVDKELLQLFLLN